MFKDELFDSITDLHRGVVEKILWEPEKYVDLSKYPTVYSYDNVLRSKTCVFEFDLASVGLTSTRWTRFLTQYVKRSELRHWLDSVGEQRGQVVNLFRSDGDTKVRPSLSNPELEGHRWGVCFLGISFRKSPKPTMTLYSRAARFPTTATMEFAFVSNIATELKKIYNIRGPIALTWYCSVIHMGSIDLLPYLIARNELNKVMKSKTNLGRYIRDRYVKLKDKPITKEAIPYGRMRRVAKRVKQMEAGEPLKTVMTQDLSLWKGNKK